MAFVNEYIPESDYEKYQLNEIDGRYGTAGIFRDWTIDRRRNIYLKKVNVGRDEISNFSKWTFYWKGNLLLLKREALGVKEGSHGLRHVCSRINIEIPGDLEIHRKEIQKDLVDAFNAYGGGGVYSTLTNYVHNIEFVE